MLEHCRLCLQWSCDGPQQYCRHYAFFFFTMSIFNTEKSGIFRVMMGYFCVSIINWILAWTKGFFTCVCDLCACVHTQWTSACGMPRWRVACRCVAAAVACGLPLCYVACRDGVWPVSATAISCWSTFPHKNLAHGISSASTHTNSNPPKCQRTDTSSPLQGIIIMYSSYIVWFNEVKAPTS